MKSKSPKRRDRPKSGKKTSSSLSQQSSTLSSNEHLVTAIHNILEDETFKFDSRAAREARETAVMLLDWATKDENLPTILTFLQQLQEQFQGCIKYLNPSSINRDRLWQSFFMLRSSEEFINLWEILLSEAKVKPTPTLYQQLTTLMFNKEINKAMKIESSSSHAVEPLTNNEGNALRYTAGYICRHLRKQLERGNHDMKEELVLCLMELTTNKDSHATNTDEEWTRRVDRGGLWYVKNTTYLLFVAIEEEVRKCLKQLLKGSGHKSAIIKHVVESEEVAFYWLIAQADFDVGDEETYTLLLHKIVELFVTVRGHSYASNLMEKHKQATAKGTQRAKALRRELHDSTD